MDNSPKGFLVKMFDAQSAKTILFPSARTLLHVAMAILTHYENLGCWASCL